MSTAILTFFNLSSHANIQNGRCLLLTLRHGVIGHAGIDPTIVECHFVEEHETVLKNGDMLILLQRQTILFPA